MEGVSTGTAGLIGLSASGPDKGSPHLVTYFVGLGRKYSGYLSQDEFGDYRFLTYAVEHLSSKTEQELILCGVMSPDAKCAQSVLEFTARECGKWGNFLRAVIVPPSKAKTQIFGAEELV